MRITEQPQTDGQARPVAQEPLHQLAGAQLAGDLFHIVDAVKGSRIPVTRERRLLAQSDSSRIRAFDDKAELQTVELIATKQSSD